MFTLEGLQKESFFFFPIDSHVETFTHHLAISLGSDLKLCGGPFAGVHRALRVQFVYRPLLLGALWVGSANLP